MTHTILRMQCNSDTIEAEHVQRYYQQQSETCAPIDAIQAVLKIFNRYGINERVMSAEQLKLIKQTIGIIPTGRQRKQNAALEDILFYLRACCGWRLPSVERQPGCDREHQWIVQIYQYSALAADVYECYQHDTAKQIMQRGKPALAWMLLTLMIDVAPLPLSYWCERLNDKAPLKFSQYQIAIGIKHPKGMSYFEDTEPPSETDYAMTPLAIRAFQQWQDHQKSNAASLTVDTLLQALNQFLASRGEKWLKAIEWQRLMQALWLHRFNLPPEILKDFSYPMRHVSEPAMRRVHGEDQTKHCDLFTLPTFPRSTVDSRDTPFKKWPHIALIKHIQSPDKPRPMAPDWQQDNLLPRLLFDYVLEFEQFGGVKKSMLAPSTIIRYTNFKAALSGSPLSFDIASDKQQLQAWAMSVYSKIQQDPTTQWSMYQFFRFLTLQPLTAHLDLSAFVKVTQRVKIDALSLSAEDVHTLVTMLLKTEASPMQALFAAAAALLAYYGALRRGEVLRLRIQDIRNTSIKGQGFNLEITHTQEGRTKNGFSRSVHVQMPEIAAKLVRVVLHIKKDCAPTQPLIGFEQETIATRALHYILPVTKGLKHLFGKRARFHHLRHSGVKLLYQQALCLAKNEIPSTWCDHTSPMTNELLCTRFVKQRFHYWLEGRPFSQVNNMLLFDEIGREVGHHYYATTRLHYLHGMDWVAPAFIPQVQYYSHAQLRFVLGMKINSNDIARVLKHLDPGYAQLSPQAKKSYSPSLNHATVIALLATRLKGNKKALYNDAFNVAHKGDNCWYALWTDLLGALQHNTSHTSFRWQSDTLIPHLHHGTLDFSELSQLWWTFGKYKGLVLNRSLHNAIKVLGEISLQPMAAQGQLLLTCPCNQKIKMALNELRISNLRFQCHITLYQNRKRLDSQKWDLIQTDFLTSKDTSEKIVIPAGKTHISICLRLNCFNIEMLEKFQTWWNTQLTHQNKVIK